MRRVVNRFIKSMQNKKLTLALAESVTCGLAAHQLSTVKGTSEVLQGSIVCYHEDVKIQLLNLKKSLIDKYTAESAEVTKKLATNLKKLIDSDIHAAITGLASSDGSETKLKPVGTVFYTIIYKNKIHEVKKHFRGSPLEIRWKMCEELYKVILKII